MSDETLRVGTRASALAMAQSGQVAQRLGSTELVTFVSDGDRTTAPLSSLGGAGVFVSALREALLAGEADLIVHSYKDLPTAPADGLILAAVPQRADARDVLASRGGRKLAALPEGARVGTGSPRRRAQLLSERPDLEVVDIRGNVDSRLARIGDEVEEDRRLDAIVLAAAGLDRLGRLDEAAELLDINDWPTAPAQGALAIEVRADAPAHVLRRVRAIDHASTRQAAAAERGVLAAIEAGCAAPLAAHAFVEDGLLMLTATVYALDGSAKLTASHAGYIADGPDVPSELAARVAEELLEGGAAALAPLGAHK